MSETAHSIQHGTSRAKLYMAFELGDQEWKLSFSIGLGQSPRRRTIAGGDLIALDQEIRLAKKRFGLAETAGVLSCYEAGRDGFPGLSGQPVLAAGQGSSATAYCNLTWATT